MRSKIFLFQKLAYDGILATSLKNSEQLHIIGIIVRLFFLENPVKLDLNRLRKSTHTPLDLVDILKHLKLYKQSYVLHEGN